MFGAPTPDLYHILDHGSNDSCLECSHLTGDFLETPVKAVSPASLNFLCICMLALRQKS